MKLRQHLLPTVRRETVAAARQAGSLSPGSLRIAHSPRLAAQRQKIEASFGCVAQTLPQQDGEPVAAATAHMADRRSHGGQPVVQARLDTALPDAEFRKSEVTPTMTAEMATSAQTFAQALQATQVQHGVLAGQQIAAPQTDRLVQVAPVADRLQSHLNGKFSTAKRTKLVADHTLVRTAEQAGLPGTALAEVRNLYAVPHVPAGNTLNKKLKGIFAAAATADVSVTMPVLRSLIRAATAEDRTAAAANPRLLEQAVARVHPSAFADYVVELGVQQAGTVAQTSAERADELIRTQMAIWAPANDIGGLSIAGHVAILKGEAWERLVRSLFAGRLPGGQIRDLLETTNAFEREGRVYINADRGNAGTMIHEGVHKYAPNAFLNQFGEPLNEGVTEFFARQICAAQNIVRTQYQDRYLAAVQLVGLAGEAAVRRAYFAGDVGALAGIQMPVVD